MGSEDVEILGVDYGAECLCLSRSRDKKMSSPAAACLLEDGGDGIIVSSAYEDDCIIIDDTSTRPRNEKLDFVDVDSISIDGTFQSSKIEEHTASSVPASKRHQVVAPTQNIPSTVVDSSLEQSPVGFSAAIHGYYNSRDSRMIQMDDMLERNGPSSCMTPTDSHLGTSSGESIELLQEKAKEEGSQSSLEAEEQAPSSLSIPSIAPVIRTWLTSDIQRTPKCWTACPNCPADVQRKFHLIDVAADSAEWTFVSSQLQKSGFMVSRIQRIQNETLWQRLCYEKQLMLKEKKSVNEQLLYHTSRSTVEIISEEGLDIRLSTNGSFGSGIYFSDNPVKCNNYWRGMTSPRYMFCCRVLLGDIKVYPKGKAERLRREPRKEHWSPGSSSKYYDSVMGNLSGENEFVVYNMYRVMPEYVLFYEVSRPEPWLDQSPCIPPYSVMAPYHNFMMLQKMMMVPKKRKRKRH